jgi:hypothetical protein
MAREFHAILRRQSRKVWMQTTIGTIVLVVLTVGAALVAGP